MNILYSITLKSCGPFCTLQFSTARIWFVTSFTAYLENISLLDYIALVNVISLYDFKRTTLINMNTDLWTKSKYQNNVKLIVAYISGCINFPKLYFSTESLNTYHWQLLLSVVFCSVVGSFHSFWRKCLTNAHIWITIIWLLKKKQQLMKKAINSTCN